MSGDREAPHNGAGSIGATIIDAMQRMGVAVLPRNYEIFYEIYTGSNKELRNAFAALGARPSQEALDGLAEEYLDRGRDLTAVEAVQDEIALRAQEILALLGREQSSLEKFGTVLNQTSGRLEARSDLSRGLMNKIVGIMVTATEAALEQSRQISHALERKTEELEAMRTRLERYKHLADTDPLTELWNRRSFDRKLAEVFANPRSVMFNALILADIDGFKSFNDRHGHPAGDRVLQSVAEILEARADSDCFVARTGGEEFAMIVEGLSEDATMEMAEAVRAGIEEAEFDIGQEGHGPINISIGVCMASDATSGDDLYVKADRALYASKIGGRNRVTLYSKIPKGALSKDWLLYRRD